MRPAKRRGLTHSEKSAFVFVHRWSVVKRRDRMSERDKADLATMVSYLPELKPLRDFVDRLEMLFEERQSEAGVMKSWPCPTEPFIPVLLRAPGGRTPVFAGIAPILRAWLGTSPRRLEPDTAPGPR